MDGGIGEEISQHFEYYNFTHPKPLTLSFFLLFCTTKTFLYHNCYLRVHIHDGRNAATTMQECGRNAASPMTPQNYNFSRSKSLLSKKTTASGLLLTANN